MSPTSYSLFAENLQAAHICIYIYKYIQIYTNIYIYTYKYTYIYIWFPPMDPGALRAAHLTSGWTTGTGASRRRSWSSASPSCGAARGPWTSGPTSSIRFAAAMSFASADPFSPVFGWEGGPLPKYASWVLTPFFNLFWVGRESPYQNTPGSKQPLFQCPASTFQGG